MMNAEVLQTRIRTMPNLPKPDHEQVTHDKSRDTEGALVVRSDGREEITFDDPRSPWIQNAQDHARLEDRIDVLDVRLENLEGRMENLEGLMGKIEDRMGNMEGRMGNIEERMGKLETKVENIEGHLVEIKEEQKTQRAEMKEYQKEMRAEMKADREAMIASFESITAKFSQEMKALEDRFDKKRDDDLQRSDWIITTTLIAIISGAVCATAVLLL